MNLIYRKIVEWFLLVRDASKTKAGYERVWSAMLSGKCICPHSGGSASHFPGCRFRDAEVIKALRVANEQLECDLRVESAEVSRLSDLLRKAQANDQRDTKGRYKKARSKPVAPARSRGKARKART